MENTLETYKCDVCKNITEFIKDEMAFNQIESRFIERAVYYCSKCDESIYRDKAFNVGWAEVKSMCEYLKISPDTVIELIKEYKETEKYKQTDE